MSNRVYDHRPLGTHSHPVSSGTSLPPLVGAGPGGGPPPGLVSVVGAGGGGPGGPSVNNNNGVVVPGGGGGVGGGPPVHPNAARLNDLLEFVKAEFEQVSGESGMLRAQREEYEAMINHHANELQAMRAMSYDLERKHHDDKRILQDDLARLQDENLRLRQQLDLRPPGSSSVPPPSGRPTLPSLSAAGARPGSGAGPTVLFGDRERGSESYGPYGGDRGGMPSMRDSRDDGKDDRFKGKAPPSKVGTPLSTPYPSVTRDSAPPPPLPSSRPSSTTPAGNPAHNQDGEGKTSEAFDPETVTRDLKKEGSDWMTMFNPNVKRVLDVGLVHTLVHDSVVCCVRFSPDGKVLATGCNRNTTLYDTKTGAKISVLSDESTGNKADNYIRSASFSPDGKLLATGSEDRIVRIWNISQKRISKIFQGHKSEIYSLAFSPDGRRLVSGSGDKTARMWDMETGTCLFTLAIEDVTIAENGPVDAGVTSVVMSPDGKFLAAGSLDTVVRIWDAQTGTLLDKLKGHKDSVYSVAFSPDGKFLVSGSLDKTLKMWDMASLKAALTSGAGKEVGEGGKTNCMTTLQGHKDYVLSVDISPDGAWIVSGSKDRGVQFWDPRSAKAQFMLQVISVAVADVGGLVATGSGDWSARIWSYERLDKGAP